MDNVKTKKIKKKHLNKKKFLKFLIVLIILLGIIYYFLNLKIKHIEILGTNLLTDNEIIDAAGIKNYPNIFGLNTLGIKNNIRSLDLVNDVKVKKSLNGKITIIIDEAKVLFFNKSRNKLVLSNGREIDNDNRYLGIPSLINYVPDDIYNDLIKGLSKVDNNILELISELEYSPSKAQDGSVIDDKRFLMRMNDSNTVYMNTINVTQLNKYIEICSAILATQGDTHGVLYLDSSTEENYSFESYAAIAKKSSGENVTNKN